MVRLHSDYNPKEEAAIWVLPCSKMAAAEHAQGCTVDQQPIKYKGKMDLVSLARFTRVVDINPIVSVQSQGILVYLKTHSSYLIRNHFR